MCVYVFSSVWKPCYKKTFFSLGSRSEVVVAFSKDQSDLFLLFLKYFSSGKLSTLYHMIIWTWAKISNSYVNSKIPRKILGKRFWIFDTIMATVRLLLPRGVDANKRIVTTHKIWPLYEQVSIFYFLLATSWAKLRLAIIECMFKTFSLRFSC